MNASLEKKVYKYKKNNVCIIPRWILRLNKMDVNGYTEIIESDKIILKSGGNKKLLISCSSRAYKIPKFYQVADKVNIFYKLNGDVEIWK